jgi:phage virion morphogenesis protein
MAGATLTIEVDSRVVQAALARLDRAFDDMTEPMGAIGDMLVSSTTHRFMETNRGPDGSAWTPSLRAIRQGNKTLVARGHLRDSITHIPGPDSVQVGTNLVYAAIHQFGGKAGRGHKVTLPARPYLGLEPEDERGIAAIIDDWAGGLLS